MKFATKIAAAATAALVLSAGSALAFNNHHYGGTAKFYAHNASGASGTAKAGKWGGCGCYGKGHFNVTNSSEQFNNSYKKVRYGYKEFGGESGGRNTINANWKNTPYVGIRSNTSAFGASGIKQRNW